MARVQIGNLFFCCIKNEVMIYLYARLGEKDEIGNVTKEMNQPDIKERQRFFDVRVGQRCKLELRYISGNKKKMPEKKKRGREGSCHIAHVIYPKS